MAAPLLHTRLSSDVAATGSATLSASRTGLSNMLALESDFFSSPPRKTVRFGGTVTDVLLKYKKGETNDLELLKNQLSDPDIKVILKSNFTIFITFNYFCTCVHTHVCITMHATARVGVGSVLLPCGSLGLTPGCHICTNGPSLSFRVCSL
eukprot:XP_006254551.1 PREDICTED: RNA polymerase I-specific transcription initiation factor RRN3-like [Rattus norvegicus]